MGTMGTDSKAPFDTVKKVQFGILGPDEITKMSVTPEGIQYPLILDKNRKPVLGGAMDPRQGPVGCNPCLTCEGSKDNCPGHFGHINLAAPIFHVHFILKCVKILRCVCVNCSKLLVSPQNPKIQKIMKETHGNPRMRFLRVYDLCVKKKICETGDDKMDASDDQMKQGTAPQIAHGGCGRYQPTSIRRQQLHLTAHWEPDDVPDQGRTEIFTAEEVRRIFTRISDEECTVLGLDPKFARPEWMIITVFPVSPPSLRPAVKRGKELELKEDDLTVKLKDIVKSNNEIYRSRALLRADHIIAENINQLQLDVALYMDSESTQTSQKSSQPISSVKSRLKGKEGRARGNLMGKRVDFSARSVISPDPNLRIDQVGIPRSVAQALTFPVIVSPLNIESLEELVNRPNPTDYPGANCVIRRNGEIVKLKFKKNFYLELECGDIVERHIVNEDLVMLNRQPTLHKMSMMAHRVRVLPWSTFRMNLSCTTPYNADFDGDEMNIHAPQSLESVFELENIHVTPKQIISPKDNKPVMGIVQDALCAARKMTKRDVFLDRDQMMNLLMFLPTWDGRMPIPAIIKPKPMWTGKQLFTLIIPGNVNMTGTHSTHPDDEDNGHNHWISQGDTRVIVQNGELIAGILCKKSLGASAGSLIHVICMEQGHEVCGQFINNVQTVLNNWLLYEGLSIGIVDTMADAQTFNNIEAEIQQANNDVDHVIDLLHTNQLQPTSGNTLQQTFEMRVNQILNSARDRTGTSARNSLSEFNNLKAMVVAGSKGSDLNIAQVVGFVGQQNVDGKRIPYGFKRRTLPHFNKDDNKPHSRGFIENSYLQGLNPYEFYFHAMGGREGIADTAVKTGEIGYIQRSLMKAIESVMVCYDGTVRNATGDLIQCYYGEDGFSPEALESQTLPTIKPSHRAFQTQFKFELTDEQYLRGVYNGDITEELMVNRPINEFESEWEQLIRDRNALRQIFPTGDDKVVLPCNVQRMIENAQKMFRIDKRMPTDLSPLRVITDVRDLIQRCFIVKGDDHLSAEANKNATFLFHCLIRSTLCAKRLADEYRLSSEAFEWLIQDIETRFRKAQAVPGEMVGAIAAESLGEPATQMTLNTFHFAGVSSKNVTLGVPRLREIINVTKKMKAPSCTIFLTQRAARDEGIARTVLSRLEHATFSNFTLKTEIYFDPDHHQTIITDDQDFVNEFYDLFDINPTLLSPWTIRMELDRQEMTAKGLNMRQLAGKVNAAFGDDLFCIHNDDDSETLLFHIRMKKSENVIVNEAEKMEDYDLSRNILAAISDMTVKGIKSLNRVYMLRPQSGDNQRFIVTDTTGEFQAVDDEWILETDGTALLKVLSDRDVDRIRTYSNDVCEIMEVLGIEASRRSVQKELEKVFTLYGIYVNKRHFALLADVMSASGHLNGITRHGITKQNPSPLMKCTFEETANILLDAGEFADVDPISGVSERLIMGQLPCLGTGSFDLLLDTEMCLDAA